MVRQLRIQYPGAWYHITCRGNERRSIFGNDADRRTFLNKLSLSLEIYRVRLYVYVCMQNHFHLVVQTEEANLSEFMRHFNITYTSVFNRKHKRVGHLYQGRYKAFLIDADSYLLEVSRYTHLNPVRGEKFQDKAVEDKWKYLMQYPWSSMRGYLTVSERDEYVDYAKILSYFGGDTKKGRNEYSRFVYEGLERIENPLKIGCGHGIVGEKEFIERVKIHLKPERKPDREQPAARELRKGFSAEELIEIYCSLIGKNREEICRKGKHSVERAMLIEFLYRYCFIGQPAIGKLMGNIDYSAVSIARKRFRSALDANSRLARKFCNIDNRLREKSRLKI